MTTDQVLRSETRPRGWEPLPDDVSIPRQRVPFTDDVIIVGGCGHVGLPLGIALAAAGLRVRLLDINDETVARVNAGELPFREPGADRLLAEARANDLLEATSDPTAVSRAEHVIVVIGTPVDDHLNPDPQAIPLALEECAPHLVDGQLLILRSTVYPGVTALIERLVAGLGRRVDIAFCPERIAEGKAMEELHDLPQIVAARSMETQQRAEKLFRHLTDKIVHLEPEEAELAKLFTNVWRYIKFATANQFYMIANDFGLDFERIRSAVRYEYPRAAELPGAGFAAGPCLFKDTMQLAAFNNNNFALGHSAMLVNEGLPLYIVSRLERRFDLPNLTVGILGMAFKGDSDDNRASLGYKLRRILQFKSRRVLCTDPYVDDPRRLVPLDQVLAEADVLIVGAPHSAYRSLRTTKPVVDISNLLGNGVRV
jgi:UDP-N-acetyl-D-mannosaminuronic acid dehydrogenase